MHLAKQREMRGEKGRGGEGRGEERMGGEGRRGDLNSLTYS